MFHRYSRLSALLVIAIASEASAQQISVPVANTGREVTVTAITPHIFKITNAAAGTQIQASSATVLTPDNKVQPEITSTTGSTIMSCSGALKACIYQSTGAVTIAGTGFSLTDEGLRPTTVGNSIAIDYSGGGNFFGAGEHGHAMTLTGDTLTMYNRANYGYGAGDSRNSQMNISMPLLINSRGYAILFDDHAAATLVASNPIRYTTESPAPISYYVIDGSGSVSLTIERLSALTGRQELPPVWALGYITSKYGYRNQSEMLGALDSLKHDGYPVDGIVLDLYWYGKEQDMGRLAWDPEQWPDHAAMLRRAKDDYGVNTVLISQPFVLSNGHGVDNFNSLSERGLLLKDSVGNTQPVEIWVGEGGMFDVSNPSTRHWLADRYRTLTDEGVGGWWGDLGEPERHPESAVHANGLAARLYHNQYGNDWSSILYCLYDSVYPDRRAFNLMRGGTTGLQRYSVFPWSSDVARSWEGLQAQVPVMVHSGLSGLGYMSHDVGGFAVNPDNPSDSEMYLRWMQTGLFSPVLRTHAQYMAEPYHYSDIADQLLDLVKARYRMLPYTYTLAYENASKGLPLVRPVWFHDVDPSSLASVNDEYLWGRDVLVAPVMTAGTRKRRVVFPDGIWMSAYDPSLIYPGGTEAEVDAPLDRIPVFVRAGSFLPSADYDMDNTTDYRPGDITVNYYPLPGVESDGIYYADATPSLRHGVDENSCVLTFSGKDTGNSITVDISATPQAAASGIISHITLAVHALDKAPASVVTSSGSKLTGIYNAATKTYRIDLTKPFSGHNVGEKLVINR